MSPELKCLKNHAGIEIESAGRGATEIKATTFQALNTNRPPARLQETCPGISKYALNKTHAYEI